MKFSLVVLVLLATAYCASFKDKRIVYLRPPPGVAQLKDVLGPDATEADCEQECHHLEEAGVSFMCPFICQILLSSGQT